MTIYRSYLFVALGVAFFIGCSDSTPQPWESGKSETSAGKDSAKSKKEVANNDAADKTADQAGDAKASQSTDTKEKPEDISVNLHGAMHMPGAEASTVVENDGKLELDGLHWTVPKSWVRKSPGMMVRAEYAVPMADGDKENARLTVSQASGTLDANIDRWKGQFTKLDKPSQETIDVDKVKVTIVDLSGTFVGMAGAGGPHDDYRMLGAIAEVPGDKGMLFIKCYGPAKTIAAHADEIKAFIRSMKVEK